MRSWNYPPLLAGAVVLACLLGPGKASAEDCSNGTFSSTYELIQKAVFENHGCTDTLCHGSAAMGGLDLRAEVSYDNLLDVDSTTVPGWKRVVPGRRDASLLFVNLGAKTLPQQYHAPLRAMPLDPVPALSTDQLEAIRRWVETGAPREGVVKGTADLLDACLPPPEPIEIKPLDPPAPGTGVQLKMPKWILNAHSEREVCFASYFDLSSQVPAQFRGPDGKTFRYKRNNIRQDPLSHHLIVTLYEGNAPPDDPEWGAFVCHGGARDGQSCPPTDQTFCGEGLCATVPVNSVACVGFGPGDAQLGLMNSGFTGTQETASELDFPEGVYRQVPLSGMVLWNSHAFNLTDLPGKLEAWLNFDFATPEEQVTPARQIFDASQIFKMNVPAFKTEEVCNISQLPRNAHLFELSAHGHQRMKRWRTYLGAFTCQGGPANGQACSPLGYDLASPDTCQGAPCGSMARQHACDCDYDSEVDISELISSINIALGSGSMEMCADADGNGDSEVSIDEILKGVNAALTGVPAPAPRDPNDSLLYVSMIYNDPVVLRYDPPMLFKDPNIDDRSLTYCALYDNGFTDPTQVKKRSTSPNPPIGIPGIGGPCQRATNCTTGKVGAPCVGSTTTQRNRSCDTVAGAVDGMCDACTLTGGVTTEDEMYILLGQYYVP